MENFNLALLSVPVSVKRVSNDIKAPPAKSSEKDFTGVLTKAEDRFDGGEDSTVVNQNESKKPSVDRKLDKNKKTGSSTKPHLVKKKSPDKATENIAAADVRETGANVFAIAPAKEVTKDVLPKSNRLTGSVDNLEVQTLFGKMFAEEVLPSAQTDVHESSLLENEVGRLGEAAAVQNNLFVQAIDGNDQNAELLLSKSSVGDELTGGWQQLSSELAEDKVTAKLFSANIPVEAETETVTEEVAGKMLLSDSKIEFATADAGKKKKIELIKNLRTVKTNLSANAPNAKISAVVQSSVSDFSTAAVAAEAAAVESETDDLHPARMTDRLSVQGGVHLPEIPDEAEVNVASEVVVSDEKLQHKTNYSKHLVDSQLRSGSQTGAVHLQGRARESQPSLMQSGQEQKDSTSFTTGGEKSRSRAAFMDELKQSGAEKVMSESALQSGTKDKPLPETNFSKSVPLADVNPDFGNTSALKKAAKPMSMPISDDHLLNQIQAGLTRPVNGRQTVTIKLWPEHLGRVDVKLVMHKQHLTATFMVDHPEVKDAMMRKIDSLRDGLGLHGIDAKDISIKVSPVKPGNGMSLMADNQSQQNNNAWRQFNPDNQSGFGNGNSQSRPGWGENGSDGQVLTAADLLDEIVLPEDCGIDLGSLHITA